MGSGEAAGEWLPRVGSARYCRARRPRAKCDRGRVALGLDRGRERPPRGDPGRHRGAREKNRECERDGGWGVKRARSHLEEAGLSRG